MADYSGYAELEDIEAQLGYSVDDIGKKRPSKKYALKFMEWADGVINGEMRESANITDSYGMLKPISIRLTMLFINNSFAVTDPEVYTYEPVILIPEEIRIIHAAHKKWVISTYEIGG